jgi:hypothetical protein
MTIVWLEIEKSSDLIGNRNRDLTNCSIVAQPTTLPRAPKKQEVYTKFWFVNLMKDTTSGLLWSTKAQMRS